MDPLKFVVPDAVEKKSGVYRAVLRDENGTAMSFSILTSFELTLYDLLSGAIINSRNGQDVLNANQVTVDSGGNVTWFWLPIDMTIMNPGRVVEEHVALFEAKWFDSQARPRQLNHEIHFMVNRIPKLV